MKKGGERQLISPPPRHVLWPEWLPACGAPVAACGASAGLQLPAECKPRSNFPVLLLLFHPLTRLTPSLLLVPVFTSPSTGTPRLALSHTQISLPFASSRLPQPIPTWPPWSPPPAPAPSLSKTSRRLQRRPDTPPPPPAPPNSQPITFPLRPTAIQDRSWTPSLPYNTNYSLKAAITDVALHIFQVSFLLLFPFLTACRLLFALAAALSPAFNLNLNTIRRYSKALQVFFFFFLCE